MVDPINWVLSTFRDAFKIILDWGKEISKHLGVWLKDIARFIFTNFKYDSPSQLLVLAFLLFFMVIVLMSLFAVGIGTGVKAIEIGSGKMLSGTGEGDTGSLYKDIADLVGESPKPTPIEDQDGDTDNDGLADGEDNDIDGDGIPNSQDFDIDGDGISNEDDPNPCGEYITDCDILFILLCGNDFCDSFKTLAGLVIVPTQSLDVDCSDGYLFYDIPVYCFNDGTGGDPIKYYKYMDVPVVYNNAVCGINHLKSRLNSRCSLDSDNSIWYIETALNCPNDCNTSDYDCYKDFTCNSDSDNCNQFLYFCCPSGTLYEGHCVNTDDVSTSCNTGDGVIHKDIPLTQLKHVKYHCQCGSNQDCIDDYGGDTCCPSGTYHEGFCYDNQQCDSV